MAMITALNAGITGLKVQEQRISVIGDNIANVNTVGYKQARVNFETMLSTTLGFGSAPTGDVGGTDPVQMGLGTTVGSITRAFTRGSLDATGLTSDLAIEDSGELASNFFILKDANGTDLYTRDGSFTLGSSNYLQSISTGYIVQGWMADYDNFAITSGGPVGNLSIPVGDLRIARATENVDFDGNLDASGETATSGTVLESDVLYSDAATTAAVLTTDLVDLQTATGDLGLAVGDVITLAAEKGSRNITESTFVIGDLSPSGGTTLGDLLGWLEGVMGIDTTAADQTLSAIRVNPSTLENVDGTVETVADGGTYTVTTTSLQDTGANFAAAGVQVGDYIRFQNGDSAGEIVQISAISTTTNTNDTLTFGAALSYAPDTGDMFTIHEPAGVDLGGTGTGLDAASAAGVIRIAGNTGLLNALSDVTLKVDGVSLFDFSTTTEAAGESTRADVLVYDSLGAPRTVAVTYVKQGLTTTGNQFRWFAECDDNYGGDRIVGSGLITFDSDGQFLSASDSAVTVDLTGTGADTELTFDIDLTSLTSFSQGTDANNNVTNTSDVAMTGQDGFEEGTLIDWSVASDGLITGVFDNGLTRTIAQVVLARFANPDGLEELGGNLYGTGVNSGIALVGAPGEFGRGTIVSGYLEESNVDLSYQFTELIVGQRAYQANARTITVADEMLQELMNLI